MSKPACSYARTDMTPCVIEGVCGAEYAWTDSGHCVGCGRTAEAIRADDEIPAAPAREHAARPAVTGPEALADRLEEAALASLPFGSGELAQALAEANAVRREEVPEGRRQDLSYRLRRRRPARVIDSSWVPEGYRFSLTKEPDGWWGTLRLKRDYLGYLISEKAETAEACAEAVRESFLRGPDDRDRESIWRWEHYGPKEVRA